MSLVYSRRTLLLVNNVEFVSFLSGSIRFISVTGNMETGRQNITQSYMKSSENRESNIVSKWSNLGLLVGFTTYYRHRHRADDGLNHCLDTDSNP